MCFRNIATILLFPRRCDEDPSDSDRISWAQEAPALGVGR